MASPSGSGATTGSSGLQNSGSEEDLQQLMDQRKRKRMISNRESARRSRMRKQKHLDDLSHQVSQLRSENNQIITRINGATQQFLNAEAENSVLRAQAAELYSRLQSLNEIIDFVNASGAAAAAAASAVPFGGVDPYGFGESSDAAFMNESWNNSYMIFNQQPLMASADILHY